MFTDRVVRVDPKTMRRSNIRCRATPTCGGCSWTARPSRSRSGSAATTAPRWCGSSRRTEAGVLSPFRRRDGWARDRSRALFYLHGTAGPRHGPAHPPFRQAGIGVPFTGACRIRPGPDQTKGGNDEDVARRCSLDARCRRHGHDGSCRRCAAALGLWIHGPPPSTPAPPAPAAAPAERGQRDQAQPAGLPVPVHRRADLQPVRAGRLVPGGPSGRCPTSLRTARKPRSPVNACACATIPTARAGPRTPTSPACPTNTSCSS